MGQRHLSEGESEDHPRLNLLAGLRASRTVEMLDFHYHAYRCGVALAPAPGQC